MTTEIILEYDTTDEVVEKLLEKIRSRKGVKITKKKEKSPYNQKFVKEILESRKSKGVVINVDDLWK